jgi:hypothetical protein
MNMLNLAHDHFENLLGTHSPASSRFNWERLGLSSLDLSDLDLPFSMEELKHAIDDMPVDKAPGPDGFSGCFFHVCWDTVKEDLLAALQQLYLLDRRGLKRINTSLFVLIPKQQ